MIPLVRRYLKTSIAFLFVGLLLGAYMIYEREIGGVYPDTMLVTAHSHLLLIGFFMMMVMGVAIWMFPKPKRGDERYRPAVGHAVYWVMTVSVAVRFLGEVLSARVSSGGLDRLVVGSAFLQIAGIFAFFLNLLPRIRGLDGRHSETGSHQARET